MKKAVSLRIPLGYKVVDKTESVKVWQAKERLLTKRARRHTKAVRNGDDVYLHARYLVCPYCGKRYGINMLGNEKNPRREWRSGVPKATVEGWEAMQMSFFEDAQGKVLCRRDVTAKPEQLCGGAVYKVLQSNHVVIRNVTRLFQDVWQTPLPYSSKQIDLMAFFKMTLFVGYPASFYDCIPFAQGAYAIERSFRSQSKKLHFAKNINRLYTQSLLPQTKSVRRILFENPGLFFYANEINEIWKVLQDPNFLCFFLSGIRVFEVLSTLHMRPGVLTYISDYCCVKGAKSVVTGLQKHWDYMREHAIDYSCMSDYMRAQTRASWRDKSIKVNVASHTPEYSLPMRCPGERIKDCNINGYHFFWLRSSNDYRRAAEQLQNCLSQWRTGYPPVVCVRKGDEIVAAIEIRNHCVAQARGFDNASIQDNPYLYEAVKKWMKKYRLEWLGDEDDDVDYDLAPYLEHAEMPF